MKRFNANIKSGARRVVGNSYPLSTRDNIRFPERATEKFEILQGDCTELLLDVASRSVDLIVNDTPSSRPLSRP